MGYAPGGGPNGPAAVLWETQGGATWKCAVSQDPTAVGPATQLAPYSLPVLQRRYSHSQPAPARAGLSSSTVCSYTHIHMHTLSLFYVYRPSQRPCLSNGQNPLGMSNTNAIYETTARSETRKLARVRPARCPACGIWP
jgi:hypothetical protein